MPLAVCVLSRLLARFQEKKLAELNSQFTKALAALLERICYVISTSYAACDIIDTF